MILTLPRLATGVALVVGAVALNAAERATFVLTDGERVSGEVVFHTEARTNIRADKNEFNLKINSGIEMPIPFDHVVYIDFVGGTPRAEELTALPPNGHLMTLRSGETRRGRLVDFIAGTTVRWNNNGRDQELPITDVRRIYLKVDRVREMFPTPASPVAQPAPTPTPSPRAGQTPVRGRTVTVRGADAWVDTDIAVRGGQMVRFQATGQVYFARTDAAGASPDGGNSRSRNYPVPDMLVGGLIGKIGPNGAPFPIGANTQAIRMPATGRLMLGINDDDFNDNSGAFQVIVGQ